MKQTNVEMSFSGKKVTEIVGISYRQLDYWTRTELISPSIEKGEGSGSRRRYSYKDLLELRVIKNLIDGGIKVEKIREIFDLKPAGIKKMLNLAKPIYQKTASFGHFGRKYKEDGFFTWEKLDKVKELKALL